jgi:hypothetical protein
MYIRGFLLLRSPFAVPQQNQEKSQLPSLIFIQANIQCLLPLFRSFVIRISSFELPGILRAL